MKLSKWLAPIPPYLAVLVGLFFFQSAWFALFGFHLAIILVLVIARPAAPINILFKTKHFKWTRRSVAACAGIGIALYYFHAYFGLADNLSAQLGSIGLNASTWPVFIAYFAVVNPLIEEYFWREYLGNQTPGFYLGDLIYAGYHGLVLIDMVHWLTILFTLVSLTFVGWLWRQIRREDEGLLLPVLGHMAGDFSILTAVYFLTS